MSASLVIATILIAARTDLCALLSLSQFYDVPYTPIGMKCTFKASFMLIMSILRLNNSTLWRGFHLVRFCLFVIVAHADFSTEVVLVVGPDSTDVVAEEIQL